MSDPIGVLEAALDALATFGSMTSPLVTFDVEQTDPNIPPARPWGLLGRTASRQLG